MSIEFIDGFDHYTNGTNLARKWDSASNGGISSGSGRFGGGAFGNNAGAGGSAQLTLPALATRVIGFAFFPQAMNTNQAFIQFYDGATVQVDVRTGSTTGTQIQVTRNGTNLATSTFAFILNQWYYLEFKATIGSSGYYEVRVNGTVWLSGTANTQATSNASFNKIVLFGNNNILWYGDDLYILNSSGTVNNDFL